jgi:hypothetical protein
MRNTNKYLIRKAEEMRELGGLGSKWANNSIKIDLRDVTWKEYLLH